MTGNEWMTAKLRDLADGIEDGSVILGGIDFKQDTDHATRFDGVVVAQFHNGKERLDLDYYDGRLDMRGAVVK